MRKTSEESSGDRTSYFFFWADFSFFLLSSCTLIVAVAIVGNLMVCYEIMVDRNLRNNPMMLLLLSVVIGDLRFGYTDGRGSTGHRSVFCTRCPGAWGTSVQDIYHNIRYFSTLLCLDPSSY